MLLKIEKQFVAQNSVYLVVDRDVVYNKSEASQ